jgi:hypothetical protein
MATKKVSPPHLLTPKLWPNEWKKITDEKDVTIRVIDDRLRTELGKVSPYAGSVVCITDPNGNEIWLDLPHAEALATRLFRACASTPNTLED